MQPSKTILKNRLNLPDLSGNNYKKKILVHLQKKKLENPYFFPETVVIGQSSSNCPGFSVHTVKISYYFFQMQPSLLNGTNYYAEEK